MTYEMRLHEVPFNQIKNGSKTIESRLNDEKRRDFKVGDLIKIYKRPDESEFITVEIINLHVHKNFVDLFKSFPSTSFGGEGLDDLTESIYQYYSKDDEEKYGVVGIELNVI